jgi:microcompartment protein CcmK/EutM
MNKLSKIVLGLAVSVAMVSCDPMGFETNPSSPDSMVGVSPVILIGTANNGGNVECTEAGVYALSSGRVNYEGGSFEGAFPAGFEVTVTDGKYVSWSYTAPDNDSCLGSMAVIVKGSAAANVYYYEGGVTSDSGLASPVNSSGGSAGLSNLTFCFNLVPCEDTPVECSEETAFGGDMAGAGSGWWFAYDTEEGGQQTIYAGQKAVDGAYVAVVDGVLTIELGANMKLQDVTCETKTNKKGVTTTSCNEEQVKVQAYDMLPSSRPAAGQFTTYKGRDLSDINVGSARYVVIHLDVEVCE